MCKNNNSELPVVKNWYFRSYITTIVSNITFRSTELQFASRRQLATCMWMIGILPGKHPVTECNWNLCEVLGLQYPVITYVVLQ